MWIYLVQKLSFWDLVNHRRRLQMVPLSSALLCAHAESVDIFYRPKVHIPTTGI